MSCTSDSDNDQIQPAPNIDQIMPAPKAEELMSSTEASELLLNALDIYRNIPYNELVNEVGGGDSHYLRSESPEASNISYNVETEINWENANKNSLLIKATLYAANSSGPSIVAIVQEESMIILEK